MSDAAIENLTILLNCLIPNWSKTHSSVPANQSRAREPPGVSPQSGLVWWTYPPPERPLQAVGSLKVLSHKEIEPKREKPMVTPKAIASSFSLNQKAVMRSCKTEQEAENGGKGAVRRCSGGGRCVTSYPTRIRHLLRGAAGL